MNSPSTPAEQKYRWPAEWEPHDATWIAWPHNVNTWPGHFASIPSVFELIVRTLARYEQVFVLAGGEVRQHAEQQLSQLKNVTLLDIPTNDVWIRDYGPTFVASSNGKCIAGIKWQFNSWGEKYPPWDLDNAAGLEIIHQLGVPAFDAQVVMEGGSIEGNGQGIVLTTRSCLLEPSRNGATSPAAVETLLQQYLGDEVIWIEGGPMAGDDTDGHVDQLARFVSHRQVVVASETNRQDENFAALQKNVQALRDYRSERISQLEVIPLPMPQPIFVDQHRVPASYCNFYIANNCLLVPVFDDPQDQPVLAILRHLFPHRDVIGIPARELIWGLGALHCMTQQQPARL